MPTGPIIKEGFPLIGAMLIIAVVLGFLGHYVNCELFHLFWHYFSSISLEILNV